MSYNVHDDEYQTGRANMTCEPRPVMDPSLQKTKFVAILLITFKVVVLDEEGGFNVPPRASIIVYIDFWQSFTVHWSVKSLHLSDMHSTRISASEPALALPLHVQIHLPLVNDSAMQFVANTTDVAFWYPKKS